jgi:AraC-like DNA-binding protein
MSLPAPIPLDDAGELRKHGIALKHRLFEVSEAIRLALTEASSERPVTVFQCFENPSPKIGFNFCLEGTTSFALTRGFPTAFADSENANTFVMPTSSVRQEMGFRKSLSLLTFYIDAEAFLRLVGESAESLPSNLMDASTSDARCYFEKHRWQPVIRSILSQVFHSRFSPNAQKIFIEAKALELVAIILDLYSRGLSRKSTLSKPDVERIHHARDILLKDLARPPSLSKLARLAGTNEFTLKKGFKEVFDLPVFKTLQQMRLAKAYEMFQATNLSVGEVAALVGYESPSSFLRAFVGMYGMRPKDVKRIPFRTI